MKPKIKFKKILDEPKVLVLIILFICKFNFFGFAQMVCSDFTITGTSSFEYVPSLNPNCKVSPLPAGQLLWTDAYNPTGFIRHTFNTAQTDVSIWYTTVNDDDFGTINVNGGGIVTFSTVSGCASFTGNILGPYTGSGWADILVNIQSTLPFTQVTLVNTGGQSGHLTGDCNSVIINSTNTCNIYLGKDTTLCHGETLTLDATTSNATYLWQDNSTNPTFNVTQQGTYWVEVTLDNCSATDTIMIDEEVCVIILEIPNVFTPNNDGVNDLFIPTIRKGITSIKTVILNRWGNIVFETNNLNIEWNGENVSDGVYFWIVYYTDINGIENKLNGFVTKLK